MTGVNEIEYVQLTLEDLDEVEDLLSKEFYPRENVSRGIGEDGATSKTGMHRTTIKHCLASGVSVGARNKTTGSLVGVRTSYITTRGAETKFEEEAEYSSDKERYYYTFQEKVKGLHDVFQDPEVDIVLDFDRICVHTDHCRRGIGKNMVEMSISLGEEKGCQLSRVEVTSPYTEKLFLRLGFQIRAELDYHKENKDILSVSNMDYKASKILTKRL